MDIRAELLSLFEELKLDPVGITDETRFKQDLDVDSTELVEIGVALEHRLPMAVDTAAFPTLKTFGEMVAFVEEALTHV